jgi:prepilin-type N-terminal cleavage/methylation domain-containing protein
MALPGMRGTLKQRGFTLLELVVVIVIISILLNIAINALLRYQVDAERTAMQSVLGGLRSAVTIQVAHALMQDDKPRILELIGSNPMHTLAETPHNYLGEFAQVDWKKIQAGRWLYVTGERALVYVARNEKYFNSTLASPARARFRLLPVYEDKNKNGRFDSETDTLQGIRLAALEPYQWTD